MNQRHTLTPEDYAEIHAKVEKDMAAMLRRGAKRMERRIAEAQRIAARDEVQVLLERYRPHCGKPNELLLPRATYDAMPRIHATSNMENAEDVVASVKFFDPSSGWTWYGVECGPVLDDAGKLEDIEFFGLVHGFEVEYGYFTLTQLGSQRGRFGLPMERDFSWTPKPIKAIQVSLEQRAR